jgi:signal transduction histidine kinase
MQRIRGLLSPAPQPEAVPDPGANPVLHSQHSILLGMLTAALSFTAALACVVIVIQPIDDRALALIENEVPSIQHLSAARFELSRLGHTVGKYRAAGTDPQAALSFREGIVAARQLFEQELSAYRALPDFPGKAAGLEQIDTPLARLRRTLDGVLVNAEFAATQAAAQTIQESFDADVARVAAAIARVQRLNEFQARSTAHHIIHIRSAATWTAALLGAAGVVITLGAMVLVLRAQRAREQLVRDHMQLLTDRGTELELFAARVAHDLRDPLHAVSMQVLAVGAARNIEPPDRERLDAATRQLKRINHMIAGLLEFARAGAAPAKDARAELARALQDAVAAVQPRAEAARVELRIDPAPETVLVCSPGALSCTLLNLLGNAVKYVVEGQQLPRVVRVRTRESAHAVRLEIEDNGPGIPLEAEQAIFEPYRRLATTRQAGIGLGLATVKKLVQGYGGRVGVVSSLGQGSTFWFEMRKAPGSSRGR